jgi:hypothetical protein
MLPQSLFGGKRLSRLHQLLLASSLTLAGALFPNSVQAFTLNLLKQ